MIHPWLDLRKNVEGGFTMETEKTCPECQGVMFLMPG